MLVGELASGPVDVIGDVHGEIDVLETLLSVLGYDSEGRHPDRRTVVFVGDLTDRGPDSPAVVRRVRRLVDAGRAQCVLGNHELNILRHELKDGNAWFFGQRDCLPDGAETTEVLADDRVRDEVREFFATLPMALERDDLRVVHACWHEDHVASLRGRTGDVVALGDEMAAAIDQRLAADGTLAGAEEEATIDLRNREQPPAPQLHRPKMMVRQQNEHPIKVLTSGLEEVSPEPFWAGGKWRFESRVTWWADYTGPMTVVGHYWRSRLGTHLGKGANLFEGTDPLAPLGKQRNVMVADYSIGRRARERHAGGPFETALAAYRWPEGRLVFAD